MNSKGKNIKGIMAVIAIFVTLSVIVGVVMAVTSTGAPMQNDSVTEQTDSTVTGSTSDVTEDSPQTDSTEGEAVSDKENASSQDENASSDSGDSSSGEADTETAPEPTAAPTASPTAAPTAPPVSDVSKDMYSAVWISYLEFQSVDFSSKSAFKADVNEMFANCADMGINTVIVQVRPFGDALYKSDIFPTSHLVNGVQGAQLSFDPLEEMVKIAHSLDLRIEAWVNPYRVRLHNKMPDNIAQSNPANNTDLVFEVGGGVYYNPALEEVQDMVVDGIAEIVENYDVDGIHLDDYFYNENADMSIDKSDYTASGTKLSQEDWRRENVNTLVRKIYKKVKSIDSGVTFGISPQGNNDNNYHIQYSDVNLWLREEGYVDYIMPQLYWGFGYLTKSGRDDYQFINLCEQWADYPRHSSVKLYIGMGAYRIGDGDGGANDQSEWSSGNNLMKMVAAVDADKDISGFGLYRYDNLFKNSKYPLLAQSETEHLADILK